MSCHGGLNDSGPFGPTMFIRPTGDGKEGVNLSPYGEWNWSMMGLSERDSIFSAQLESEIALHPTNAAEIQNTCLSCHGVMGQRQLKIDNPQTMFNRDIIDAGHPTDANYKYGALARDGVSCSVCHQIVNDERPLEQIFMGKFEVSGADEKGIAAIYGPFDNPTTQAMEWALGMKPEKNDYIKSSGLCASCHVVVVDTLEHHGENK